MDIKANDKPVIMVFNKIDAYILTIDEDDLMTEKTPRHNNFKSGSPLDES
jgi:GTP-binding protein HflX